MFNQSLFLIRKIWGRNYGIMTGTPHSFLKKGEGGGGGKGQSHLTIFENESESTFITKR